VTSLSDAPDKKRIPSCQSPVPASSAKRVPLSPSPEDDEVQHGITVLPVKSFAFTKPSTVHAAMPHQIGYPASVKYGTKKNYLFSKSKNVHSKDYK
jgi:hypothetical protein